MNPLGVGAGGRAGVSLFGFYGGINYMYYFGGSNGGVSQHAMQEGAELGYGIKLPFLVIRPQVGVGNFTLSTSGSSATGGVVPVSVPATNANNLYVEPGLTVLIPVAFLYFGADANALILPGVQSGPGPGGVASKSQTDTAFTAHGQIGIRF